MSQSIFRLRDSLINQFRHRIVGLHVHDNLGDDEHKRLGNGSVDWKSVKEQLKGFNGLVTIESVPVRKEDLRSSVRYSKPKQTPDIFKDL